MNKPAVIEITDALTAETICKELEVGRHSVRYARTTGVFPASWYAPMKVLCERVGISCPLDAFNWKSSEQGLSVEAG